MRFPIKWNIDKIINILGDSNTPYELQQKAWRIVTDGYSCIDPNDVSLYGKYLSNEEKVLCYISALSNSTMGTHYDAFLEIKSMPLDMQAAFLKMIKTNPELQTIFAEGFKNVKKEWMKDKRGYMNEIRNVIRPCWKFWKIPNL